MLGNCLVIIRFIKQHQAVKIDIAFCAKEDHVRLFAVPNNLTNQRLHRRSLLLKSEAIDALGKRGQHIAQDIKLTVAELLLRSQRFHLADADLQRLALSPQRLNAPGHLLARDTLGHIGQRIKKRRHLPVQLRPLIQQISKRFIHIFALSCVELLAFFQLRKEIVLVLP